MSNNETILQEKKGLYTISYIPDARLPQSSTRGALAVRIPAWHKPLLEPMLSNGFNAMIPNEGRWVTFLMSRVHETRIKEVMKVIGSLVNVSGSSEQKEQTDFSDLKKNFPKLLTGIPGLGTRNIASYRPTTNSKFKHIDMGKKSDILSMIKTRLEYVDLGFCFPDFHYMAGSENDGAIFIDRDDKNKDLNHALIYLGATQMRVKFKFPQKSWEAVVMIHEGMKKNGITPKSVTSNSS